MGCLILDEVYNPKSEGVGVCGGLVTNAGSWCASVTEDDHPEVVTPRLALAQMLNDSHIPATSAMHSLLTELQRCHDWTPVAMWPTELKRIEDKFFNGVLP